MLNLKRELKDGNAYKILKVFPKFNEEKARLLLEKRSKLYFTVYNKRELFNNFSESIAVTKGKNLEIKGLISAIKILKNELMVDEQELEHINKEYEDFVSIIPNIPDDNVPEGKTDKDNVEIERSHSIRQFDFEPKHHIELNKLINIFDFERAAKISGRGNVIYTGKGALLEMALLSYMFEFSLTAGRKPVLVPYIVNSKSCFCTGQLPKFEKALYKTEEGKYMIPTSEVPLISMYANEIVNVLGGPMNLVSSSACFRYEAGAAGVLDRGIIRTHQFNKIEMVSICRKEDSDKEFRKMVDTATGILEELNLPYRIMQLCTGDLPFAAANTNDIEVWLPGQKKYYECSSISSCNDFQGMRGKIRYKDAEDIIRFAYTLNGSGLATSRLMVAILENGQDKDGNIHIPQVLWKYTGFKVIEKMGV